MVVVEDEREGEGRWAEVQPSSALVKAGRVVCVSLGGARTGQVFRWTAGLERESQDRLGCFPLLND